MEINKNFLADAGFGLVAAGGQALTMQVNSCVGGDGHHRGYADVVLNKEILLQMAALGNLDGLLSISPMIDFSAKGTDTTKDAPADGVEIFRNFMQENTCHISKMNFRATAAETLPTSVLILTPNVFTGQLDRQVLNVTADTTMYQQQSNIVTMNNVDVYIGRNSIIRFAGAFDRATAQVLNIDITIDKYISVERALVQNLQLLATASGQVVKAIEDINEANAVINPNSVSINAANQAQGVIPVGSIAGWIAANGGNNPTTNTVGSNSRAARGRGV